MRSQCPTTNQPYRPTSSHSRLPTNASQTPTTMNPLRKSQHRKWHTPTLLQLHDFSGRTKITSPKMGSQCPTTNQPYRPTPSHSQPPICASQTPTTKNPLRKSQHIKWHTPTLLKLHYFLGETILTYKKMRSQCPTTNQPYHPIPSHSQPPIHASQIPTTMNPHRKSQHMTWHTHSFFKLH